MEGIIQKIVRNPASSITTFFVAISVFIPFYSSMKDEALAAGVDPRIWAIGATALASLVIIGQMWQRLYDYTVGVSWRAPSSWGYLLAGASLLTPLIANLADTTAVWNIPNGVWVGISFFITAVTTAGRYMQAVYPAKNAVEADLVEAEDVPQLGGEGEPAQP